MNAPTIDFEADTAGLPTAMSVKRVIQESGLSKSSIYRAIREGELRALKKYGKTIVPRAAFVDWLNTFQPLELKPKEEASEPA